MIKLQGKLPRKLYLACSGGIDSMAALDFLKRKHDVFVLHYNHRSTIKDPAMSFVEKYCADNSIGFLTNCYETLPERSNRESQEEYWRRCRYNWLERCTERQIVTAHHLDDCVETWVWSSMHGTGKIIPYNRTDRVIRPFRLTRKRDLRLWADVNNVPYIEDQTNSDTQYIRNYIRHEMMSSVLKVNPGIHKTIAKKVREDEYSTLTTV
jgi:tRNA(Ile)-lysidine synthase